GESCRPEPLLRIYRRVHRHPRSQKMLRILTGIQHDFYGHALDHLHEVTRRILRRQQAEARAGGAGDRIDLSFEIAAAKRVDVERRALTGPHALQLRLLVIRDHPDVVELHDGRSGCPCATTCPTLMPFFDTTPRTGALTTAY